MSIFSSFKSVIIVEPVCVAELFLHACFVNAGLQPGNESGEALGGPVGDEVRHAVRTVMRQSPIEYDSLLIMTCVIAFLKDFVTLE